MLNGLQAYLIPVGALSNRPAKHALLSSQYNRCCLEKIKSCDLGGDSTSLPVICGTLKIRRRTKPCIANCFLLSFEKRRPGSCSMSNPIGGHSFNPQCLEIARRWMATFRRATTRTPRMRPPPIRYFHSDRMRVLLKHPALCQLPEACAAVSSPDSNSSWHFANSSKNVATGRHLSNILANDDRHHCPCLVSNQQHLRGGGTNQAGPTTRAVRLLSVPPHLDR